MLPPPATLWHPFPIPLSITFSKGGLSAQLCEQLICPWRQERISCTSRSGAGRRQEWPLLAGAGESSLCWRSCAHRAHPEAAHCPAHGVLRMGRQPGSGSGSSAHRTHFYGYSRDEPSHESRILVPGQLLAGEALVRMCQC